jgi:hypothetical protein
MLVEASDGRLGEVALEELFQHSGRTSGIHIVQLLLRDAAFGRSIQRPPVIL